MKIIKVTSKSMNKSVYINVNHIGEFHEWDGGTRIGVTTHNNGGYQVKETIDEVLMLIKRVKPFK